MAAEFPADVIADARDAVKAHLRAVGEDSDEVIAAQAANALALCEAFTGQAAILRDHVERIAADGAWQRLAAAPVAAVVAVAAVDDAGATVVLDAERFAIDIDARGDGWVRVAAGAADRAHVTYAAGLAASWAALPAPLAQGVVLLAAHLLNGATDGPPAAVAALWRPLRRMRLAGGRDARA